MNFNEKKEEIEEIQEEECNFFQLPKKRKIPMKTSIDMIREEIIQGIEDENPNASKKSNECSIEFQKQNNSSNILENQMEEENIKKNQNLQGEWGIQSLDDISNSFEGKDKEEEQDEENIQTKSMERVDPEENKEEEGNLVRQTSLPVGQNLKAFNDIKKMQKLVKQATQQSKKSQKQVKEESDKNSIKLMSNDSLLQQESDIKLQSLNDNDPVNTNNLEKDIQDQQKQIQQQQQQTQQQPQFQNQEILRQFSLPVSMLNPQNKYNNEILGLIEESRQVQQQQQQQPQNYQQQFQQKQQQQQAQSQFSQQQLAAANFPSIQSGIQPPYQLNEQKQIYYQNQQQQPQYSYNPQLPRSLSGQLSGHINYQYDYYYGQKQQQQQQYQQQQYQNYISFKNNSNTKQEKRKPLVLNESRDKYYGTVKFFDEHKLYGFIILDCDNSEIFFHMDDVINPKVTKEYIATYKTGNIIRFKFGLMDYIGKYNQSRKATELELVKFNEMYQQ